jgi:hypothetical protein
LVINRLKLYFGYYDYIFIQPCHKSCHKCIFGWVELSNKNLLGKRRKGRFRTWRRRREEAY